MMFSERQDGHRGQAVTRRMPERQRENGRLRQGGRQEAAGDRSAQMFGCAQTAAAVLLGLKPEQGPDPASLCSQMGRFLLQ